jgi:hypothetical protein
MILHPIRRNAADIRDAGGVTEVIVLVAMMGDVGVGIVLQAHRFAERMMMMGRNGDDQHPHADHRHYPCYISASFHHAAKISFFKEISK